MLDLNQRSSILKSAKDTLSKNKNLDCEQVAYILRELLKNLIINKVNVVY
ncbi:MAG: hypothetical protein K8Q99_02055 [Acholeplasmataceae bacterium]|nr:hypothetical protein [Acholeplasmataceae bacterium]MCD4826549.1 hypothetical protein [Acholeplasmataceae bacterium]